MCKIIKMKIKILKDKMWGMRKLAISEIQLTSKSWHIRNTLSIHSIQDKKRSNSSMNKLYEIWFGGSPTERRFESIKCLLSEVKEI
jgi:hypothetical protein